VKVTKDVILDLLPLYLEGEASADTCALVREFFEQNPEVEHLLRASDDSTIPALDSLQLPAEAEMRTLRRTRRMVTWRSVLLALAVFFSALTGSFSFDGDGVRWLLAEQPVYAGVCAASGLALWAAYLYLRHRLRSSGL
jgi:hypothetical protein